jgi:peptidoglycan/xylan/chitin deacetylase (PgdA/CDA1 family)
MAAVAAAVAFAAVAAGCSGARPQASGRSPAFPEAAPARIQGVPFPEPPKLPGVVFHGSRQAPLVALTFDTNMTDAMLAELDKHRVASFANTEGLDELDRLDVPATVFLAGKWMERYPEITRRMAADPHFELASHSYAHRPFHAPCFNLGRALPLAEMAPDVSRSEDLLRTFTDHPTPYFRFPGGCYDAAAVAAVAGTGVTIVQWDVVGGDAFGRSVATIVRDVLDHAQSGSIVVLHLTGGNTAPLTAKALPAVVGGLRARGLRLVKLSELLAVGTS